MIQGGCPQGTGTGGPGYTFEDEINDHKVVRGALAMANAGPEHERLAVLHRHRRRLPVAGRQAHGVRRGHGRDGRRREARRRRAPTAATARPSRSGSSRSRSRRSRLRRSSLFVRARASRGDMRWRPSSSRHPQTYNGVAQEKDGIPPPRRFPSINPATGEQIATVPDLDAAAVAELAKRGRAAQVGWDAYGLRGPRAGAAADAEVADGQRRPRDRDDRARRRARPTRTRAWRRSPTAAARSASGRRTPRSTSRTSA